MPFFFSLFLFSFFFFCRKGHMSIGFLLIFCDSESNELYRCASSLTLKGGIIFGGRLYEALAGSPLLISL